MIRAGDSKEQPGSKGPKLDYWLGARESLSCILKAEFSGHRHKSWAGPLPVSHSQPQVTS